MLVITRGYTPNRLGSTPIRRKATEASDQVFNWTTNGSKVPLAQTLPGDWIARCFQNSCETTSGIQLWAPGTHFLSLLFGS